MNRLMVWMALWGTLCVLGCGKAKEPKTESGAGGQSVASNNANNGQLQAPAPDLMAPAVPKPVDVPPASGGSKGPPQELKEGFNWFGAGPEGPQYEIAAADPNEIPPNLAAVTPPAAGTDSTTFAVVSGGGGNSAAGAATSPEKFTLPDGLTALPEFGTADDGAPLRVRSDKDGATMAYVPSGTVKLGLRSGPEEVSSELAVPLDAFYIDVTEVTVQQYEAYRTDMKESKKQVKPAPLNPDDPKDFPARGVPWGEAKSYATWAGKSLPTEAMWEMAAQSERGYVHPWGNGKTLWAKPRNPQEFTAVKSFKTDKSVFGVFDLAGNVREWVSDPYSPTAYKDNQSTPVAQLKNWDGPKRGVVENMRVVKGNGPDWTVWQRAGVNQASKAADVGFRCAVLLKTSGKSSKDSSKK